MAVSIMSACCRASVLSLFLFACFLQVFIQEQVFLRAPMASHVLMRSKRANKFLLEEILQGNLERECYEEMCSYEEAREYFEDTDKTIAFWTVYYETDQCQPNPCLHGGNCTVKVGGFQCSCSSPHYGPVCELSDAEQLPSAPQINAAEMSECPTTGPTACHQLCTASHHTFTCSCMPGFELQADRQSCLPEVEFPCGRLPDKFNTTVSMCRHGNCPWQVSLHNSKGLELCAGVVLGRRSVLTTARCLFLDSGSDPRPSNFYVVTDVKKTYFRVRALYIHSRFRTDRHDNDLALLELADPLPFSPTLIQLCLPTKDFCENILMHSGKTGIVERRGVSQNQDLVYMTLDECRSELNVSHPLSNKMFCMRHNEPSQSLNRVQRSPNGHSRNQTGHFRNRNGAEDQMSGNRANQTQHRPNRAGGTPADKTNSSRSHVQNHRSSEADIYSRSKVGGRRFAGLLLGTPVATVDRGTAFLTGLLMSSSAGSHDSGLVFTKISRYLGWIRPRLEVAEDYMTPQVNQYPEER